MTDSNEAEFTPVNAVLATASKKSSGVEEGPRQNSLERLSYWISGTTMSERLMD